MTDYVSGARPTATYDKNNLTIKCRGCHNSVLAKELSKPVMGEGISEWHAWVIAQCPYTNCGTVVFIEYDRLNNRVHRTYPYAYLEARDFNSAIPEIIRRDMAEAEICRRANANRAAVVLQRRVVENIAKNKLGVQKMKEMTTSSLKNKIKLLYKEGLVTKQIEEQAQEVREFGNYGAHPSDDGLDLDISDEDLSIIDSLVWDIVDTIYIKPENIKKLKDKRNNDIN